VDRLFLISLIVAWGVGILVTYEVFSSLNEWGKEHYSAGRVTEVGDNRIVFEGKGVVWDYAYYGDNLPKVGNYILAHVKGENIVSWSYHQPESFPFPAPTPSLAGLLLTVVVAFLITAILSRLKSRKEVGKNG